MSSARRAAACDLRAQAAEGNAAAGDTQRTACRRCINQVINDVGAALRNTPAECRKSYINPAVFIAWQNGELRRRAGGGEPVKALLALLRRPR